MILLLVLDVVLVRGKVLLLRRGYLGAGEETHGEDEVGMSSRGRARCRDDVVVGEVQQKEGRH